MKKRVIRTISYKRMFCTNCTAWKWIEKKDERVTQCKICREEMAELKG